MNDCGALDGKHSCAGQAKIDNADNEWVYVPKGTCTKITGGFVAAIKPAKQQGENLMNGQLAGLSENSVGLGLRSAHIDQILHQRPDVPWFEILMDNHMAQGGLIPDQLTAVRENYPISLHCVGMSLGGVDALNMDYLATLKWMIKQYQPVQVF